MAAVPAVGLLAGSAFGLVCPDFPSSLIYALLIAGAASSLWALRRVRALFLMLFVGATFAAGGALLASNALREARYPSLRAAFDALAKGERVQALAAHRVVPEDDDVQMTIEGVLRSDASVGASGVSLAVDVDGIEGQVGRDGQDGQVGQVGRVGQVWRVGQAGQVGPVGRDGQVGRVGQVGQVGRDGQRVRGGVALTVVGVLAARRVDAWRAGRRVRVPAQLRRPSRYLDPGVADNERALALRGTTLVGTVKSGALVEVVARGPWWSEGAGAVRAFARRAIAEGVGRWSTRSAGIVTAIVIGDRAGLDDEVQRRLQEAGTYHVIAISGGNIAILAGLMLGAFRLAGWLGRTAMLAAIGVLVAYAVLVGGGASVDRATLMAIVFFAGRACDQRSPPLNTLCMAAAVLVAAVPLSVADPAFALTFGATFGILLVAPLVLARRWPPLVRGAVTMLAASAAAEAALFPVSAAVFSRVTFAGLALNFLAIPLMAVAQIAGMIVVPAATVSRGVALVAGLVAHAGASGLVWSANLVRFVPVVTYRVAAPSWWAIGGYYCAAVATWVLWPRAGRARVVTVTVAGLAAIWILVEPWTWLLSRGDGRLHVTFIDVGQGDSIALRFPRGSTLLVDTGGLTFGSGFDVGDRVVAPVLRAAGIRRLDRVAFTHGDPDHIGGAASILDEFRPAEVWEGIPVPRFQPLTNLRAQARSLGARWSNVYRGDQVSIDGVAVRALAPIPADWERQKVRNDDSLVLEVRWRNVSVWLTGDAGQAVERALLPSLTSAPLRVLKVPHHGSLTSSSVDFVRALRPQVAVFSVGRSNHFGHPAPDVLRRYQDAGSTIFRTDQDGAITLDTDGASITVQTFKGRRVDLTSADTVHHEDTKGSKETKP